MSYILGIGLLYKKYKKNATIRIYIDNNLIETYQLTQNVDPIKIPITIIERIKKKFTWFNRKWFNHPDTMQNKCKIPKFLKLIEIEEEKLTGEVRIEVDNDDSNYTNGFMSKSSLIEPNFFILCPKKLLKNNGQFFFEFQENLYKKIVSKIEKRYGGHFVNWSEKPRPQWPIPQFFDIVLDRNNKINKIKKDSEKQKLWYQWYQCDSKFRNKKIWDFITKWIDLFKKRGTLDDPYVLPYFTQYPQYIGGSFHITFNINKKNKIYFLDAYNVTSGATTISMQTFSFAHYFSHKYE
jgi:hypothetical protein